MGAIRLVQAPEPYRPEDKLIYLAGGVSGPNWQHDIFVKLAAKLPEGWVVLNPRRDSYASMQSEREKCDQIAWEYDALLAADAIAFWLPSYTDCPITLFELGRWTSCERPCFIGIHPKYPKRFDLETQLRLTNRSQVNPIPVVDSLGALVELVLQFAKSVKEVPVNVVPEGSLGVGSNANGNLGKPIL